MKRSSASSKLQNSLLVINGHPDPSPQRFCAAISRVCVEGAAKRGWRPVQIDATHFNATRAGARDALDLVKCASQLVVVFPLWLDAAPMPLREFFAEVATDATEATTALFGKKTHLIVTMAMPAFARRARTRSLAAADQPQDIAPPGLHVDRHTFIGNADAMTDSQRRSWLAKLGQTAVGEYSTWRRLTNSALHIGPRRIPAASEPASVSPLRLARAL